MNNLLGDSASDDSDNLQVVVDKAQEGELKIEQMEDVNAYNVDLDTMKDKPWLRPGSDITDYFNYGFTEKTWKKYCEMQKERRGFVEEHKDLVRDEFEQNRNSYNERNSYNDRRHEYDNRNIYNERNSYNDRGYEYNRNNRGGNYTRNNNYNRSNDNYNTQNDYYRRSNYKK